MLKSILISAGGLLGVAGAVAYVFGFVIVNSHLARTGVTQSALIRSRHLAAGIVCTVILLIPVTTGVAFWTEFRSIPVDGLGDAAIPALVTLSFGIFAWDQVLWVVSVGRRRFAAPRHESLFFVGVAAMSALLSVSAVRGWPSSLRGVEIYHVVRAASWVILPLGAALFVSHRIYPQLRPDLGGGAGWVVLVSLKAGAVPERIERACGEAVILVDRSALALFVWTAPSDVQAIEIPLAAIAAVEAKGMVALRTRVLIPTTFQDARKVETTARLLSKE